MVRLNHKFAYMHAGKLIEVNVTGGLVHSDVCLICNEKISLLLKNSNNKLLLNKHKDTFIYDGDRCEFETELNKSSPCLTEDELLIKSILE